MWGVDARRDPITQIDAASAIKAVQDPSGLRSRLSQLHSSATEPPLAGVESKEFFLTGTTGPGFVVSYIPESDTKPHRAELMEGKPYIIRVGDSFQILSVSMLRNLFFPRASPILSLQVTPEVREWFYEQNPEQKAPNRLQVIFRVHLFNSGMASAKDVFVRAINDRGIFTFDSDYEMKNAANGSGFDVKHPVHPTSSDHLCDIYLTLPAHHEQLANGWKMTPTLSAIELKFQIFATDVGPTEIEFQFSTDEIRSENPVHKYSSI